MKLQVQQVLITSLIQSLFFKRTLSGLKKTQLLSVLTSLNASYISTGGMSSQQRKEIGRLTVQDIIAQTADSHENSGVSTTDSHKDGVGNSSTGIN